MARTSRGPRGESVLSPTFGDYKTGDRVFIDPRFVADRTNWMKDWHWEFLYFVTNIETGHQWVEMWGGDQRWAHRTAVTPEAVTKVDTRD